ncbi:haloacid dehalogenase type II [Halalkalicoccus ordinarius]|uniref:haloacid dehalogenase type II n=1 Tax=Halalkalicoccus ordinarius TaxID=3116651 RepID=UPI00300F49F5
MSLDTTRCETITVDSYGTLVDPSAAERALADTIDDPRPVSDLWRTRSLFYTMVSNYVDAYQSFYEMNRDALQYALETHAVEVSADQRDEILSVYHELDPFEDVRSGIERLIEGGYDVYVLSNGNPEMLTSMVTHADLDDLIADTISAHEIETFKPHVEIYRHAAGRTGTPIRNITHVAGPSFDVQGAMHAGMQGVWLNRKGGSWDPFASDPDSTVETFHDVADELGV